jgi:hypothetical protein
MGGGDHPHVGALELATADALELATLEATQQLLLELERQLAELIQEQGAAVCFLERTDARRAGAGERAALVPEQIALDQVVRDRAAVDDHERPLGTRACRVNRLRDQLLAGAGLALDQDAQIGGGDPGEHREQLAHLRRFAEQRAEAADVRALARLGFGERCQRQHAVAERDLERTRRRDVIDSQPVHANAIRRARVADPEALLVQLDLAVLARDRVIVQAQVRALCRAEAQRGARALDHLACIAAPDHRDANSRVTNSLGRRTDAGLGRRHRTHCTRLGPRQPARCEQRLNPGMSHGCCASFTQCVEGS